MMVVYALYGVAALVVLAPAAIALGGSTPASAMDSSVARVVRCDASVSDP